MDNFLIYILESTVCISVFYLLFRLLMRKETSFAVNRATLLTIIVASVIVPFIQLPQVLQTPVHVELVPKFPGNKIQIQNLPVTADVPSVEVQPSVLESTPETSELTIPLETLLRYFYLFGVLVALLLFIRNVFQIVLLSRKATVQQMDGYRLLIIDHEVPSFAFGRSVIISRSDYDAHGSAILAHEQAHIQLNHFFDLILLELIRTIHWFNPAIYALIGDLKEIHEFQADQKTLYSGIDATQYQKLIIQKGVGPRRFALANSFNHCQIKKRITMMNKSKNSKTWRWKVATFLPLLALLLMAFGKTGENVSSNNQNSSLSKSSSKQADIAKQSTENTLYSASQLSMRVNTENETKSSKQKEVQPTQTEQYKKAEKKVTYQDDPTVIKENRLDTTSLAIRIKFNEISPEITPVIYLDTIPINKTKFLTIKPDSVKFVDLLKGKSYLDKYGDKAKNGIIAIISLKYWEKTSPKNVVYFVDGIETTKEDFNMINPELLESMCSLKGDDAIKKYGNKASFGAIEIKLKHKN